MNTKEYLTEYQKNGKLYGGSVFATSFEEAQELAGQRNKSETVVGFIP